MPARAPVFRPAGQQPRQAQKREHDRWRRKAKPWRKFYATPEWQDLRDAQLARAPLCERCWDDSRVVLAAVVNHKRRHNGDWDLFIGGELQSLCKRCHDSDVQREEIASANADGQGERIWGYSIPGGIRPSAVPVHMVCGAPGAGKSTYVRERAQPGDVVIDMDDIRQGLGFGRYSPDPGHLTLALVERDRMLHALADREEGEAWLIVMAPSEDERRQWMDALGPVTLHAIDTPQDECKRRVGLDPSRAGHRDRLMQAIDVYFSRRPPC